MRRPLCKRSDVKTHFDCPGLHFEELVGLWRKYMARHKIARHRLYYDAKSIRQSRRQASAQRGRVIAVESLGRDRDGLLSIK